MPSDSSTLPTAASGASWSEAKRSALIYQRIFETIVNGEFAVNARLPSETELATRFGASRPVVREALARLRDDGVIVSRQGSGSYVKRRPDVAVLNLSPGGSIDDIQRCFEFRHGLEGTAAALAAERWEDADLAEIRASFAALEEAIKNAELGVEADERFHSAVARATHNPYYVSVQSSLQPHIRYGMNVNRNLSLLRAAERVRLVQDEHRAILEAIVNRDPDKARDAMQLHIANARRRMFEGVTA
ncbi:MAG TPA: FadR/GntR family transcriptional regulator [Pseudolabrys sp.]|nr:FadR/GntR family transcriptional regulator [Pseudolabrys sp.]